MHEDVNDEHKKLTILVFQFHASQIVILATHQHFRMASLNRIIIFLLMTIIWITLWMFSYVIEIQQRLEILENKLEVQGKTQFAVENGDPIPLGDETKEEVNKKPNQDRPILTANNPVKQKREKTIDSVKEDVPVIHIPENQTTFKMPLLEGENVISMSLWGSDGRYVNGALKNAEIFQHFFPGWKLRIYTETRTTGSWSPKYSRVPNEVLDQLKSYGAEIHFVDPRETHIPAMMWRFMVGDDMSVDHFIVRDTDGRLSARDAAVVYQWILSGKAFNCIRDHPSHSNYAVSGGLWGGVPSALRDIFRRPLKEMMYGFTNAYIQDMNFLNEIVWPRVKPKAFCSDSVSCDKWPSSHPFPVPRHGLEYLGEVYDAQGLRRHGDTQLLFRAGVNDLCVPKEDLKQGDNN